MRAYSSIKAAGCLLLAWFLAGGAGPSLAARGESELDLDSIPIWEWLQAGESAEIPWRVQVSNSELRMDQQIEVKYSATIRGSDLNRSGAIHRLFLISRMSVPGGDWLTEPVVADRFIDGEMPPNAGVQFDMRALVRPGEYQLWLVLYDRETGEHNVATRLIRVDDIRNDPLPGVFDRLPAVEITEEDPGRGIDHDPLAELSLPVANTRPVDVEVIATFSLPEQWADRGHLVRAHTDNTVGALAALSQIELANGSTSITGLDVAGRSVVFDQKDFRRDHWPELIDAFTKAGTPVISVSALEGRRNNAAFFREFLEQRLSSGNSAGAPFRTFIVLSSSLVFERGSDLSPVELQEDCRCKVYHLRLQVPPRVASNDIIRDDVFDELGRILQRLRPNNFRVMSPVELRRAIAEILRELKDPEA